MKKGKKSKPNKSSVKTQEATKETEERLERILQADAKVIETRKRVAGLKDVLKAAKEDLAAAENERGDLLREARDGLPLLNEAKKPMGWIDESTRPGRRFTLADTDDPVEFRGIDADGHVLIFWLSGSYQGESMFPAKPLTAEEWNEEWAEKIVGFVDPAQPPPADGDDSWRAVELTTLDIPPRYIKALAENEPPIVTLGDLTDWQKKKGDFWAKDISGLGEGGQEAVVEATMKFWEQRKKE